VLVLTSLGDDGGQLAGLGVAQTLTKPTKAQVLFDAVSGLFDRPIAAPPAAPPPALNLPAQDCQGAPPGRSRCRCACCWPRTTRSTSAWRR
jgi:hypothetical protein